VSQGVRIQLQGTEICQPADGEGERTSEVVVRYVEGDQSLQITNRARDGPSEAIV
jgi:hypothetical protein